MFEPLSIMSHETKHKNIFAEGDFVKNSAFESDGAFTQIELDIIHLYASGYSIPVIADTLFYSPGTIYNFVSSNRSEAPTIKHKIATYSGWRPRAIEQAALWMYREGFLSRIHHIPDGPSGYFPENLTRIMTHYMEGITRTEDLSPIVGYAANTIQNKIGKHIRPMVEELVGYTPANTLGAGMIMVAYGYIDEGIIGTKLPYLRLSDLDT